MAVEKVFWKDPYLVEIGAKVTGVDNDVITLDRTIAYAFSGGQESDSGTIGDYKIIEAKKDGKEILYKIEENHCLKSGDDVLVKIDWEKRYKIMKLHFAAELVLELMYQEFNRPEKIGANITWKKARVDFYWEGNISETFSVLEEKIKGLIDADLPIVSAFEDEDNGKRYWEIDKFAKVPCGGTHLRRTGEIGGISLKRNNLGAGKERIEIYLVSQS